MSSPGRASLVDVGAFRGHSEGSPADVTWEIYSTERWLVCVQGEGFLERIAGEGSGRLSHVLGRLDTESEEARRRELLGMRTGKLIVLALHAKWQQRRASLIH